nr:unnamed protein product [Spirometra erinaceieuropaei]
MGRSKVPKAWKERLRPRPLKSLLTPCFTYGCERCMLRSQCAAAKVSDACGRSASTASASRPLAHRLCDYIPGCSYLRKRWFNSSASNATVARRRRNSRIRLESPSDRSATTNTTVISNEATGSTASLSGSELHGSQLELSPQYTLFKTPLVHSVGGDEPDTTRIQL